MFDVPVVQPRPVAAAAAHLLHHVPPRLLATLTSIPARHQCLDAPAPPTCDAFPAQRRYLHHHRTTPLLPLPPPTTRKGRPSSPGIAFESKPANPPVRSFEFELGGAVAALVRGHYGALCVMINQSRVTEPRPTRTTRFHGVWTLSPDVDIPMAAPSPTWPWLGLGLELGWSLAGPWLRRAEANVAVGPGSVTL